MTATLQSIDDATILATGDGAVIDGQDRPAAGVSGVRAAPVLLDNLVALGRSRPLRSYRPQSRWLSIIDLGDGRGLATCGRLRFLGQAALWLKRHLDLGFVRRMRAAPFPQQVT